jgi:polyhydroxybutyrate depolymerase
MRILADRSFAWNAGGGCCGQPAKGNVDDVAYITSAVDMLVQKYGIGRDRVFGVGHSNGAMMTQRLVCESGLYSAAVSISGPLNYQTASCPGARGKRLLAIHGANDENVPLAGGTGTKGPARGPYQSEEYARRVFTASGASYTLDVVPGAAHAIDGIDEALQKTEGLSLAVKITRFFGLAS